MCDIDDLVSHDQILVLIKLAGSSRLEQYEKEIFSNKELRDAYLDSLAIPDDLEGIAYGNFMVWGTTTAGVSVRQLGFMPERLVCRYATKVIEGRWYAAEEFLRGDTYYWKWYKEYFNIPTCTPKLIPPIESKRALWNRNVRFSSKRR